MARVRCDLPNADTEISGVAFTLMVGGGMLSEEIADEIAARFCSIPGYQPVDIEAYGDPGKTQYLEEDHVVVDPVSEVASPEAADEVPAADTPAKPKKAAKKPEEDAK